MTQSFNERERTRNKRNGDEGMVADRTAFLLKLSVALTLVIAVASCADSPTDAPAKISGLRPLPDGGSELEITVENPLDVRADAHCSFAAPGGGNSFSLVVGMGPSDDESVKTNLPNLSPDTPRSELELTCQVKR